MRIYEKMMKNSVFYTFWVKKRVGEDPKKSQIKNELGLGWT